MVRRRVRILVTTVLSLAVAACGREHDVSERMDMPDTMPVMHAMHDAAVRDSMLDVMPGGEMARGDSAASMRLLDAKR